jgi:hypothetical protein
MDRYLIQLAMRSKEPAVRGEIVACLNDEQKRVIQMKQDPQYMDIVEALETGVLQPILAAKSFKYEHLDNEALNQDYVDDPDQGEADDDPNYVGEGLEADINDEDSTGSDYDGEFFESDVADGTEVPPGKLSPDESMTLLDDKWTVTEFNRDDWFFEKTSDTIHTRHYASAANAVVQALRSQYPASRFRKFTPVYVLKMMDSTVGARKNEVFCPDQVAEAVDAITNKRMKLVMVTGDDSQAVRVGCEGGQRGRNLYLHYTENADEQHWQSMRRLSGQTVTTIPSRGHLKRKSDVSTDQLSESDEPSSSDDSDGGDDSDSDEPLASKRQKIRDGKRKVSKEFKIETEEQAEIVRRLSIPTEKPFTDASLDDQEVLHLGLELLYRKRMGNSDGPWRQSIHITYDAIPQHIRAFVTNEVKIDVPEDLAKRFKNRG